MRKLLALLLSVAMMCSFFVGVASAADIEGEVRLSNSSAVLSGDTYGTVTVSGTITTKQGALINKDFNFAVINSDTGVTTFSGTATGGKFSFLMETNRDEPITYNILAARTGYHIDPGQYDLLYAVSLNKSLTYTYDEDAQEAVSGSVKYKDGGAVKGVEVRLHWLNDDGTLDDEIYDLDTNTSGNFGFLVNGWDGRAGKLALVVGDYIHLTGEVKPMSLTVTASPNSNIVHTIGDSEIEVKVSNGPRSGSRSVDVKLYKGTVQPSNLIPASDYTVDGGSFNSSGVATIELTSDFSDSAMKSGTYTVVVDGLVAGKKLYEGSATFTVKNPEKFTLLNAHQLAQFSVGDNLLTFGDYSSDMRIVETDNDGDVIHGQDFVYTVFVNGKQALDTDSGHDMYKRGEGTVKISAPSLANVSVKVLAYRQSGSQTTPVYEKTFSVSVDGWQATSSVETITVDKEYDISVVVKDKNGNFVNNAQVILRHEDSAIADRKQSPLISNINNGTYSFKDLEYDRIGDVQVIVATMDYNSTVNHSSQLDEVRADFKDGIKVVGENVYKVTSDVSSLLVGLEQTLTLRVTESGDRIIPDAIDYYVDGTKQDTLGFTVEDTNNDGLADAIEIDITAEDTKPILLRVRSTSGAKMGEVSLTAVAPTLVAIGTPNITADIKSTITFKVVDPRTNTALTDNVQFVESVYIEDLEIKDTDGSTIHGSIYGGSEYTVVVDASDIDFEQAIEDKEKVELGLTIRLDGGTPTSVTGTFAVKKATLSSNPPSFIIGTPGNLTITYNDANGKVLAGYMVKANGTEIGKTNSQGQVVYVVAVGSSSSIKITAETDHTDEEVELTITSTFDNQPPTITAPASVEGPTATITITDNVRIARLMVNGVEVSIFPLTTINHVVSVNHGINTFAVVAMDNNYNVAEKSVTITRGTTPPVTPPPTSGKVLTTVINQRGYTVGGFKVDFAAVEYNANGDTMMPLRMLESLGATATWDETNKTATLTYGNNVVSVAIGGSVAVVNGRAVALVGASGKSAPAYLVPGRTMVPTRFISEQLGFTVQWAPPNNLVITAP